MKIENLTSINYTKGAQQLHILVKASSEEEVRASLVGREKIVVKTDNEEVEQTVEEIEGYAYLVSIEQTSEGMYELVLTNVAPTPQSVLDKKLSEITAYDTSDAVNSFTLDGETVWLDKATRVGLMNSTQIEKAAGHENTTLWFAGNSYTIPCDTAIQMLSALELYALECYNVTAQHKANVSALQTVEEIENYDYKTGYPEKLNLQTKES